MKINPEDVFWESEATTGTVSGMFIRGDKFYFLVRTDLMGSV